MVQAAPALDALGDGTRREIVRLLSARPASVRELADQLPVSRPAVSQHLRVLHDAQLVAVAPHGTQRLYRLAPPARPPRRASGGRASARHPADLPPRSPRSGHAPRLPRPDVGLGPRQLRRLRHRGDPMTDVLAPVVKSRDLPCPPEVAFALFT